MAKESYKEMFKRLGEDEVRRGVEGKLPYPWSSRRIREGKAYLMEKERERDAKLKRILRKDGPSVEGLKPSTVVEPLKLMKSGIDPDTIRPANDPASRSDLLQEHELRRVREERRKEKWRDDAVRWVIVLAIATFVLMIFIAAFPRK